MAHPLWGASDSTTVAHDGRLAPAAAISITNGRRAVQVPTQPRAGRTSAPCTVVTRVPVGYPRRATGRPGMARPPPLASLGPSMQPTQRVGFIGLGAMGAGMAASLVRAGFAVTGYDL